MRSLSDTWHGRFSYDFPHPENEFVCTLLEIGATLTGAVHEVHNHGAHTGTYLAAAIDGTRDGAHVAFTKTYDASSSPPGFTIVEYDGTLSPDEDEIAGTWRHASSSSRFIMIRANRQAFAAETSTAAPVTALVPAGADRRGRLRRKRPAPAPSEMRARPPD